MSYTCDVATNINKDSKDFRESTRESDLAAFERLPESCRRLLQYAPLISSAEDVLEIYLEHGEQKAFYSLMAMCLEVDPNFKQNVKYDIKPEVRGHVGAAKQRKLEGRR